MRDFGVVVWAIVILAGVVSSIVKSARRNAAVKGPPTETSVRRLAEARRIANAVTVRMGPSGPAVVSPRPPPLTPTVQASPVPQPPGTPLQVSSPPTAPVAPTIAPLPNAIADIMPHLTEDHPIRRRFAIGALLGNRRRLADAVIVSEVIGKPLALRNE